MKWLSVVGARPNFIKIAPFCRAIEAHNAALSPRDRARRIEHVLVHTGQHYDDRMSHAFFTALDIPRADLNLNIGSGSHGEQVGRTMIEFEPVLARINPDLVIVVGDVNATLACSVTARKQGIPVAHIEAGLRSHDMGMPEEINRIVTDSVSDILLTPDHLADENLRHEGHTDDQIRFVGNIMIDTLERERARATGLNTQRMVAENLMADQTDKSHDLRDDAFAVITLHRPSNVDDQTKLKHIVELLHFWSQQHLPLVWPIHPRTLKNISRAGWLRRLLDEPRILLTRPLDYHGMLNLNAHCRLILTDSGGLQEECCVLGTPCVTLRDNTERPITLTDNGGTNRLTDIDGLPKALHTALNAPREPFTPELWDGRTAPRIVDELMQAAD